MSIAVFQSKAFQVTDLKKYTIQDFSISGGGLKVDNQEMIRSKPSTYVKGIDLQAVSLTIPLKVEYGINPRKEIDEWEAIKQKAVPAYFILGTKPVTGNKMLLINSNPEDIVMDGSGNILKASLKLEFQEYIREGSAKSSSSTSGSSSASGTKKTTTTNWDIFYPPDKADNKRTNSNASLAKLKSKKNH